MNRREEHVRDGRPPHMARDPKELRILGDYARQFLIQGTRIFARFIGELPETPRERIVR